MISTLFAMENKMKEIESRLELLEQASKEDREDFMDTLDDV